MLLSSVLHTRVNIHVARQPPLFASTPVIISAA